MKMRTARTAVLPALVLLVIALAAGCTISSGLFLGKSQSSSGTSLSSSYVLFDGSMTRLVSLRSGDEVTYSLEGGEGLSAVVEFGGKTVFTITDGSEYTASEDGFYSFTLQGKAEDGSFSLSWDIE